ncbi:MAG TPA: hypothetical protein VK586_23255 [Streptosporangiaceae bacterium]|nr:hypothetical protein [Streptosporangiaceae bacterium]
MTSDSDLKRLGRRGSYRLGQLRTQGVGPAGPPPLRPRFRRPWHRGPAPLGLLAAVAGAAVIAGGAAAGLWFAPFLVGLAAGLGLAGLRLGHALTQYARAAVPGAEVADAGALGAADAGAADVRVLDAGAADAGVPDVRPRAPGRRMPGPAGSRTGGRADRPDPRARRWENDRP